MEQDLNQGGRLPHGKGQRRDTDQDDLAGVGAGAARAKRAPGRRPPRAGRSARPALSWFPLLLSVPMSDAHELEAIAVPIPPERKSRILRPRSHWLETSNAAFFRG